MELNSNVVLILCTAGDSLFLSGGESVTAKTVFAYITLLCGVPFKRLIPSLITCTIW